MINRFKIICAAQMKKHLAVFDHRGQIQRLCVYRKFVFAKLNDVLAIDIQFFFVAQLANGIFANRLQAALNIVDFDRFIQLRQLFDDVADLVDHQIGSEIAVDLVDRGEIGDTRPNAFEDSIGGAHQCGGSFVSGFDQLQLFRIKSGIDFFAFFGELNDEFVELGKPAFDFFDLNHHFGQIFVATIGRIADIEIVDNGLADQFHLRIEFGFAFDRHQLLGLLLQRRLGSDSGSSKSPRCCR